MELVLKHKKVNMRKSEFLMLEALKSAPHLNNIPLMPMLAAYRNFFPFFFISTYVGFVPASDVLAIFVSDRRCEFSLKFWFVI
jgi:hypothetical protein